MEKPSDSLSRNPWQNTFNAIDQTLASLGAHFGSAGCCVTEMNLYQELMLSWIVEKERLSALLFNAKLLPS